MTYKKASFTGRTQAWAEKQKKLASSRKATQGSISRTPAAPTVIPSPKPTPGDARKLKTSLTTNTPIASKPTKGIRGRVVIGEQHDARVNKRNANMAARGLTSKQIKNVNRGGNPFAI